MKQQMDEKTLQSTIERVKKLEFQIFHLKNWINDEPEGKRRDAMKALLEGYNLRMKKIMESLGKASEEAEKAVQAIKQEQLQLFAEQSEVH